MKRLVLAVLMVLGAGSFAAEEIRAITLGTDFVVSEDDVKKNVSIELFTALYSDTGMTNFGYLVFKKRSNTSYYDICRNDYTLFDPVNLYAGATDANYVQNYGFCGGRKNSTGVYYPATTLADVVKLYRWGAGTYMVYFVDPYWWLGWCSRYVGQANPGGTTSGYKYLTYRLLIGPEVVDLQLLNSKLAEVSASLTTQINTAKTELAAADAANKAELQAKITALETELNSVKTQMANLTKQMIEMAESLERKIKFSVLSDADFAALKTTTDANYNRVATEIAALDLVIQNLQAAGQDTTAKVAERNIKLSEYAGIQKIKADLDWAEAVRNTSQISVNRDEIARLKAQLQALGLDLNNKITALQNTQTQLREAMVAGDAATAASVQTALDAQSADIANQLQSFRTDLQGQMAALATGGYSYSSSSGSAMNLPSIKTQDVPVNNTDLRTGPTSTLQLKN